MNRIEEKFRELKKKNKKALVVFITAGYPSLEITKRLILEFARIGVDIIELGVPFSDPMADGQIIQEASAAALSKNVNLKAILDLVKTMRRITDIPICLMTYYNPIFCFGEKRFARIAHLCGVDGVIIPDLPPEEAGSLMNSAAKFNLDIIFFLSPTSSPERIKLISRLCRGFIYYVSLTGVTGPRKNLPRDLRDNLRAIKKHTPKPVCVGFGVSNRSQVEQIYKFADGVIVGSAVIKKIKENIQKADLVRQVGRFVCSLKI